MTRHNFGSQLAAEPTLLVDPFPFYPDHRSTKRHIRSPTTQQEGKNSGGREGREGQRDREKHNKYLHEQRVVDPTSHVKSVASGSPPRHKSRPTSRAEMTQRLGNAKIIPCQSPLPFVHGSHMHTAAVPVCLAMKAVGRVSAENSPLVTEQHSEAIRDARRGKMLIARQNA